MPLDQRRKALVAALDDPDETVRRAAAEALDRVEGLMRIEDLSAAAASGEKSERIRAIHFLAMLGTDDAVDRVIALFTDADAEIRAAAVRSLASNLPQRALVSLLGVLEDPEPAVARTAVKVLGLYKDPRVTEFLVSLLSGSDVETAALAAEALGVSGDPAAEHHLIETLVASGDTFLRAEAARALGRLRPPA